MSGDATPGTPTRFSFNALSKHLSLSKEELEGFLTELNKGRFISQYTKKE